MMRRVDAQFSPARVHQWEAKQRGCGRTPCPRLHSLSGSSGSVRPARYSARASSAIFARRSSERANKSSDAPIRARQVTKHRQLPVSVQEVSTLLGLLSPRSCPSVSNLLRDVSVGPTYLTLSCAASSACRSRGSSSLRCSRQLGCRAEAGPRQLLRGVGRPAATHGSRR